MLLSGRSNLLLLFAKTKPVVIIMIKVWLIMYIVFQIVPQSLFSSDFYFFAETRCRYLQALRGLQLHTFCWLSTFLYLVSH